MRRLIPPLNAISPPPMPKLSPALQRLVLAFTTGLFLACAAHVSGQSGGLADTMTQSAE